ncbi:MAG TPA: right-handed parallel beta-helix repeat-containing protein [Candidatus Binatia bacterium]|jgi:CSLREA domain-containing protein|nr:right-handed parallel beta-helix repeat-containing protein [Candidatus Binatia bacterium]
MMRAMAAAVLLGLTWVAPVEAATITVTTTTDELTDDGDCSLREAIRGANDDNAVDACTSGNGDDTVIVPAGLYLLDLLGPDNYALSGDLDVRDGMTLQGDGPGLTIVDGNETDRVFDVQTSELVTLTGVTIRNGIAPGSFGGGVRGDVGANLSLTDCAVESSTAGGGGGVYHAGGALNSLSIERCTITGNDSTGDGGGVQAYEANTYIADCTIDDNHATAMGGGLGAAGGSTSFLVNVVHTTISNNTADNAGAGVVASNFAMISIRNSTLSGNTADQNGGAVMQTFSDGVVLSNVTVTNNTATLGDGGGIFRGNGTAGVTVLNSIVAGNFAPAGFNPDCWGPITSEGHTLVGIVGLNCSLGGTTIGNVTGAASLGPLADNGGTTLTHQLLVGSPAIDAGDPATPGSGGTSCETTDQRGATRPGGTRCDMGAVESDAIVPTTTTSSSTTTSSTTITTTSSTTTSSTTTSSTTSSTLVTSTTSTTAPSITTTTTVTTSTLGPPPSSTSTTFVPPPPPPQPLCVDGAPLAATLTFAKVGGTSGDEKLTVTGTVSLPAGTPTTLDPVTQGLQLLIDQPGMPPIAFLRLTAVNGPIPPGAPGNGCDPKDGWKGTTYTNRSGAVLPPACPPGSAQGLRSVKLKDRRAKGKGIGVTAKVSGATLPAPTAPVRITIVFGASPEAGAAGLCGGHQVSCSAKKSKVTCR